jgi:hypothetical protein
MVEVFVILTSLVPFHLTDKANPSDACFVLVPE